MVEGASDSALSGRSKLAYGLLGGGVLAAGLLVPVLGSVPGHGGTRTVTASFGRAGQGLDQRSEVKVRGIVVGGVESVRLDARGRAVLRLRLDKGVRVPQTAVAAIEPVSIFGPKDVTLDLGTSAGPYLREGAAITHTKDPEDLADTAAPAYALAGTVDPQDLATILHTFSRGLDGQGPALRRTAGNSATLVDLAFGRRAELRRLITDVGALSQAMGGRGETIAGLAADFNAVAPALTAQPDKVGQLLDGAGRLSDTVSGQLRVNADAVAGLIDSGGDAVDTLHGQRESIPALIDALSTFFQGMADVIDIKGPEGTQLARASANYHRDSFPCVYLADLCADKAHP